MEELFIEYFKFKEDKNSPPLDKIKIIEELDPVILLKINIDNMLDTNIYRLKDINYNKIKFNHDLNVYKKIIDHPDFGMYIDGEFLEEKVYNFVHEYMEKNKLPISAQYYKEIFNFYKEKKDEYEYDIALNNGCFVYELIIKNRLSNILQIELDKGQANLFLNYALKNLEIINNKTFFNIINKDDKNDYNSLIKSLNDKNEKFNLIFINK